MKTLSLGSYATNLESPIQVFTVCLAILNDIAPSAAAKQAAKGIAAVVRAGGPLSLVDRYQLGRAVSSLIHDLNHHVPNLTYFGWKANDAANLGVWIDLDALHQAEKKGTLTQVDDDNWSGVKSVFVLDMSKAGLTLYRRRGRKVVWATND